MIESHDEGIKPGQENDPLERMLALAQKLPPLPSIVSEVLASMGDDRIDSSTLSSKVMMDQAIVGKVMRVANSPFYGLSRQIDSVQEAIAVIGFSNLRSLVLAAGLVNALPPCSSKSAWTAFWLHSLRAAVAGRMLSPLAGISPDTAFTAGILHDIGRLVMCVFQADAYEQILCESGGNEQEAIQIEQARYGYDHAALGGAVARRWNLPEPVCKAIAQHHQSNAQGNGRTLVDVVYVASLIATAQMEQGATPTDPYLYTDARTRLGIEPESLERLLVKIDTQADGASQLLAP